MTENEGRRIEDSQGGETAAQQQWLQLYGQYHEEVRRYLAGHVKSPQDVDELVQMVFLSLLARNVEVEDPRACLFAATRQQLGFYERWRKVSVFAAGRIGACS